MRARENYKEWKIERMKERERERKHMSTFPFGNVLPQRIYQKPAVTIYIHKWNDICTYTCYVISMPCSRM